MRVDITDMPNADKTTPPFASREGDDNNLGDQFAELLDLLNIDDATGERVSICWQVPGEGFTVTVPTTLAEAMKITTEQPYAHQRCLWFSVNPVNPPTGYRGRGKAEHVTRCAALCADLDLKDGGIPDPATAEKITLALAEALGTAPAAVVDSGHGWHAYFALDPEDDAWTLDSDAKRIAATAIYRRFHRFAAHIADKFGGRVDNISDLARVLRVPGSVNLKDPDQPEPVVLYTDHPFGGGGVLGFAEVAERITEYGVPEYTEDRELLAEVVSDPHGWQYGDETSGYVTKMIDGWPSDRPGERARPVSRHNWLVSQATRLACAHRLGRITEADHQMATNTLEAAFDALLAHHGEPRKPTPNEVASALKWGTAKAATFTDERAAEEVGGTETDLSIDALALGDDIDALLGASTGNTPGVTLPASFWESRPVLTTIRDAAWSMLASPDATLAIVLAKLSASLPPRVRVDTGVRRPVALHTFAAPTGRPGGFKTTAMEAADTAVRFVPGWSNDPVSMDDIVLMPPDDDPGELYYLARGGTGQGMVENYIGDVPVPLPDNAPKNAKPKTRRTQVRSNVLVSIDEGNGLAKALTDPNSIVGETLRELWSGSHTGQNNAKAENTRRLRRGTYSFGMVVGFQLSVLAAMLGAEHVELGTPQRFLFAWTGAPDIPDEPVADPGVLTVTVPSDPITLCASLLARVRETLLPLLRTGGNDDKTQAQRVTLVVKTSALLAILDGRAEVTEDDWALAETMADTSQAIARHALAVKRAKDSRARTVRRAEQVADAVAVHTATNGSGAERAAVRIETAISTEGIGGRRAKWTGEDGIRKRKFNRDVRDDADTGLALLVERGTVKVTKVGRTEYVELVGG